MKEKEEEELSVAKDVYRRILGRIALCEKWLPQRRLQAAAGGGGRRWQQAAMVEALAMLEGVLGRLRNKSAKAITEIKKCTGGGGGAQSGGDDGDGAQSDGGGGGPQSRRGGDGEARCVLAAAAVGQRRFPDQAAPSRGLKTQAQRERRGNGSQLRSHRHHQLQNRGIASNSSRQKKNSSFQ
jgi:hypothetical protein